MRQLANPIRDLCQAGATNYKALGEVGEFIRGNGLQKSDFADEGVPAIHYGQVHTTYGTWTAETVSHVAPALAVKLRKARPGDLIIATTSEDDEAVGKATAWMGRGEAAVGGDAYIFRHSLEPKYVAYFFQTDSFQAQKKRWVNGAKVRRISGQNLARIRIPVPPVEVQVEIVRVLDAFQELDANLVAELKARRRQHAYYRDSLLSFMGRTDVKWLPMGQVGDVFRGKRFTKADFVDVGGVGCIHYGEIYTHFGTWATQTISRVRSDLAAVLRLATKGDVVLTDVGETVEDVGKAVAWMGDEDVAIHDHCYVFRSTLNPVFVSHYMQTNRFRAEKDRHIARTKVNTLLPDGVRKILLPVPSLKEQERVVDILNKFDQLVNDRTFGIPAEINARREQFEYYRDKVLTFNEAPA